MTIFKNMHSAKKLRWLKRIEVVLIILLLIMIALPFYLLSI
jgi:hypothetical protein